MIKREDIVKIGKFYKPHGIKGEISFSFIDDSFNVAERPFLICELGGLFIPFRIEDFRFTSGTVVLVKLKTMDSIQKIYRLANKDVYFPKNQIGEDMRNEVPTWNNFIGFTLMDESIGRIGQIVNVDDSTLNTLFIVERIDTSVSIPAAEEMITRIDKNEKKIYLDLPEGLLDIL